MMTSIARNRRRWPAGVALSAWLLMLGLPRLGAQATQSAGQGAAAQFDAATIKVAAPPSIGPRRAIRIGIQLDPSRLTASFESLRDLIVAAYGLQEYQVEGPDWMKSARFDVSAVTSAPADHDQMMAMLRVLLEQRFQLKTHRDSKVVAVYGLEVAPGGSKLKDAGPGEMELPEEMKKFRINGSPIKPGNMMMMMGPDGMRMVAYTTTEKLANALSRQAGRPVLDRTGLKGDYAINLSFAPVPEAESGMGLMMLKQRTAAAQSATPTTEAAAPAPSLFTAIEAQLGLKLVAEKAPVEVLVVDGALKTPVEN